MSYEKTFELNGEKIKTTVIHDAKEIENYLSSFLGPSINHQTKVIGFDAEWFLHKHSSGGPVFFHPKCATIQFCDGHSCLIIQLNRLQTSWLNGGWSENVVGKLLVDFLSLPNITFVGVGIKENLAKLKKYYGIGCKNAVELGPLAATASVLNMPRLSMCGVDELAFVVNGFDLQDLRPIKLSSYYPDCPTSSVKVATVNVYSYHKIGAKLNMCQSEPANAATSEENADRKVLGRTQVSETKPTKHVKIEQKN